MKLGLDILKLEVKIVALTDVRRVAREVDDVAAALGRELRFEIFLPDVHGVVVRREGILIDPIGSLRLCPHDLIRGFGLGRLVRDAIGGPAGPTGGDSANDVRLRDRAFRSECRSQIRADSSAHSRTQSIDQALHGTKLVLIREVHVEMKKIEEG